MKMQLKINKLFFVVVVQPSYGVKNAACHLSSAEVEKVKELSKFNEDDPIQHMVKVMFGCGLYAGFRGNAEHTHFNMSMLHFGEYPKNHADPMLAGRKYVSISNFEDKTNKISVHNSYLRDTSDVLRFPIFLMILIILAPRCSGCLRSWPLGK